MDDPAPEPPKASWRGDLRRELAQLPQTAANIREASENLKVVSAELIDVSALLARIVRTMEATGMVDGLSRMEEIAGRADVVREHLTPPRSLDEARQRIAELEQAVTDVNRRLFGSLGLGPRPSTPTGDPGTGDDRTD